MQEANGSGSAFGDKGVAARFLLPDLPEGISEEELHQYFVAFGEVEESSIKPLAENTKRLGSVRFANPTKELKQLMLKQKHYINGLALTVHTWKMQKLKKAHGGKGSDGNELVPGGCGMKGDGKHEKKERRGEVTARYLLTELPDEIDEEGIQAYFGVFGEIEEVTLKTVESSGKKQGSVKYANPTPLLRQQMLEEGHLLGEQVIKVETWKMQKMAKPGYKEQHEAELARYFAKKGKSGPPKGWGKGAVAPAAAAHLEKLAVDLVDLEGLFLGRPAHVRERLGGALPHVPWHSAQASN